MDKTKKIIAIVAAALVILGGAIGVGYKIWFGEDMPSVDPEFIVTDTVATQVVADTVDALVLPDTTVAE